ncbi:MULTISPECIES: hypothetical protein [Asaia]|uniref:TraW n=1 Tax=Asaia spathodeae TaxID=657016 RepID=A0ABX2P855_9PROT|nr:hypothetical protein [Asaia spathodeae]GBR20317.1 hypothetical protein AA105894_2530 [Asaia spathodeae NBRC 105894]
MHFVKVFSLRNLAALVIAFQIGTLFAPRPAYAMFGIDTAAIITAISTLQSAMNTVIGTAQKVINGSLGLINTGLGNGFGQLSKLSIAGVTANQKIADANNIVQAQTLRDERNAEVRDLHAVNRQDCLNLQNGAAAVVAARSGVQVAAALDGGKNRRTDARKGTPSWTGAGQATQAANNHHFAKYCNDAEAEAGLCAAAPEALINADQHAGSLLRPDVYANQDAINLANDYAQGLIEPVAPPALRGDAIRSPQGQSLLPERRAYAAALALSHYVADDIQGWRAPTVTLTTAQRTEATREGRIDTDKGSQLEALELDINRKLGGTDWQGDLQAMPNSKSVLIQIALLDAQRNKIMLEQLILDQQRALMEATQLSSMERDRLRKFTPMTVPSPSN